MACKSKFQISRNLEERIKTIATNVDRYEPEFSNVSNAFILGFNYTNVTNYVGLTTDYKQYHAGLSVVGLVFFKSKSEGEQEIRSALEPVVEFNKSPDGPGEHDSDKNRDLFLVFQYDEESSQVSKKVFNFSSGIYLESQVKLSVLDESKLYNHSAFTKLNLSLMLDICDNSRMLLSEDKVAAEIDKIRNSFSNQPEKIKIHLKESNFSSSLKSSSKNLAETLYDSLEAPNSITQMGEYLPQLSKSEKQAMVDKWRNKVKAQRDPLEFDLEHEIFGFSDPEVLKPESYALQLETFLYIHVNDPLSKSFLQLAYHLRHLFDLLGVALKNSAKTKLCGGEIKLCTFKPQCLDHLVPIAYVIPSKPDYESLTNQRRQLHNAYLVPLNEPKFRYCQRILDETLKNSDEKAGYLCNVHKEILDKSGMKGGTRDVIQGTYTYHHYMQDRMNDNGWGCAYRSLQTIISWLKHQGYLYSPDIKTRALKPDASEDKTNPLRIKLSQEMRVPSHEEIQKVLVDVGDRQASFVGSREWIGSQEVCYVLDHLYNINSKIISVNSGNELASKARELGQHFASQSTPVMIGGGLLAHTIIGVDFNERNGDVSYLILDPHYTGPEDLATITKKGWCGWKKNNFWDKGAFYNLCLPQRPHEF